MGLFGAVRQRPGVTRRAAVPLASIGPHQADVDPQQPCPPGPPVLRPASGGMVGTAGVEVQDVSGVRVAGSPEFAANI